MFRRALREHPLLAQVQKDLGRLLSVKGRRDEATQLLTRANGEDPSDGDSWRAPFRVHRSKAHYQEAFEAFQYAHRRRTRTMRPTGVGVGFCTMRRGGRGGRLMHSVTSFGSIQMSWRFGIAWDYSTRTAVNPWMLMRHILRRPCSS